MKNQAILLPKEHNLSRVNLKERKIHQQPDKEFKYRHAPHKDISVNCGLVCNNSDTTGLSGDEKFLSPKEEVRQEGTTEKKKTYL
jgi:hypothetical protein